MSVKVKVKVQIDEKLIQDKIKELQNEKTMFEIHNRFAYFCAPYVPKKEGALQRKTIVESDGVTWDSRYAHYMYMGEVYGPNIPVFDEDGNIKGFFSPKGQKKHPKGRPLKYSKEFNDRATDHWDKAMMKDNGTAFEKQVEEILNRRASEL